MAFRSDITVDWRQSPRLIAVATPSTSLLLQDLVDTLRELEDELGMGMQFPKIIDASGKVGVGAGFTGIVVSLLNAQVYFAPRTDVLQNGTVTTAETLKLIDSAATFVTNGVGRGDMVQNLTDNSYATVLMTDSETQLTTLELSGGTDNLFELGDSYAVRNYEDCTITGGDLTAVDDVGSPIAPVLNTFGTNTTVEQSTSPALLVTDTSGLTATEALQWQQMFARLMYRNVARASTGKLEVHDAADALWLRADGFKNEDEDPYDGAGLEGHGKFEEVP